MSPGYEPTDLMKFADVISRYIGISSSCCSTTKGRACRDVARLSGCRALVGIGTRQFQLYTKTRKGRFDMRLSAFKPVSLVVLLNVAAAERPPREPVSADFRLVTEVSRTVVRARHLTQSE